VSKSGDATRDEVLRTLLKTPPKPHKAARLFKKRRDERSEGS
jgi:hypothetical protein